MRKYWRETAFTSVERPWDIEPDEQRYVDVHTGYVIHLRRGPAGAWCGYVDVGMGHRYWGKGYDAFDAQVHGGLTYDGFSWDGGSRWCFGFDCAHCDDLIPGYPEELRGLSREAVYRDVAYVREQCEALAKQLAEKEGEVLMWALVNLVRSPWVLVKKSRLGHMVRMWRIRRRMEKALPLLQKAMAEKQQQKQEVV